MKTILPLKRCTNKNQLQFKLSNLSIYTTNFYYFNQIYWIVSNFFKICSKISSNLRNSSFTLIHVFQRSLSTKEANGSIYQKESSKFHSHQSFFIFLYQMSHHGIFNSEPFKFCNSKESAKKVET